MSDPAPEPHTVETQDVTVTKKFTPDDLPVPAVRFQITSDRSDRATIRITEEVPTTFSMDSIGFHPRYDADNWTAYQDNRIVYERLLAPGEHVETVYGLRIDNPDEAAAFLADPVVSVAPEEPPAESELTDIAPPGESQAVRDLIADADRDPADTGVDGDADTGDPAELDTDEPPAAVAGGQAEDAAATPEEESAETEPDTPDGTDTGDTTSPADTEASAPAAGETDDGPGPLSDPETEPAASVDGPGTTPVEPVSTHPPAALLEALTTAIEDADAEDLQPIAEAFRAQTAPTVDARIDHLQARVEEIAAYEAALEEFLNTRGPEGRFMPELHDRIDTLEEDVDDLRSIEDQLATIRSDLDALTATVGDIEATVEDLDVDEIDAEFDAVEDQIDALEATLAEVDSEVTAVTEDLTELQEWRERLGEMFS